MTLCRLFPLSLFLVSLSAVGQSSCPGTYATACGPKVDIHNNAVYNRCVAACTTKCYKCQAVTGSIYPKYYVLGLVYSPPGCSSTTAQACTTQSSVDYLAGSTMGTKNSIQHDSDQNYNLKVDLTLGGGDDKATKGGIGGNTGWEKTSTDGTSTTISKSQTLEIKATGNADGVNHDQDQFLLLLNPAVVIKQPSGFDSDQTCTPGTGVTWDFALNPKLASGTAALYPLSVAELKHPESMSPNVAQQLKKLNFNNTDFQTILSLDPFANGATAMDPNRFLPTTLSFPYKPTASSPECNNQTCSCMALTQGIKNELQGDVITGTKEAYKVGLSESLSATFGGFFSKLGLSADQTWTWTTTTSQDDSTDSSQTATATISCPSLNYQGPTEMLIYWDNLFGSFMFVPTVLGSPQASILAQGTVTAVKGKSVAHQPVTLALGSKTYHTVTNSEGKYVIVGAPGIARPPAGQLNVGGVRQQVTLGAAQHVDIHLP